MESKHVHQQIAAMRQSFFDEEVLDEKFTQLEQLEGKDNPNFVEEVFTMYFKDSTTFLETIEQAMKTIPINSIEVDNILHQLKGSSASVGANKVLKEVNKTRQVLGKGNLEGTKAGILELRKEYESSKAKLEPYFQEVLDENFSQLEQLEGKDNPNFVEEVFIMYFRDSTTFLETIEQAMKIIPIDSIKVDNILHQLKGSSASVGANKVLKEVNKTRQVLGKGNLEGTKVGILELRKEYESFKAKLESYFQLKQANSVAQEK
ncbi:histidine-containing phosphotransfer protein 4-like [Gossypium australe]|uniref:Histidine-containing phosphotransfer protein n=1 Tax=Gossypium australe TaxID=47621 RepID=A0A5B6W9E7_9ROSI|nr:histidine-containing phosphotransfer protein 4-like [Gossypium australe]